MPNTMSSQTGNCSVKTSPIRVYRSDQHTQQTKATDPKHRTA